MKRSHLERLLGGRVEADASLDPKTVGVKPLHHARVVETGRIVADPSQPRRSFVDDEMTDLVESMRDVGQREPIRVRWDGSQDRWVIITGERRWRAAQMIGLPTMLALVEGDDLSADRLLHLQVVENEVRAALTAVDAGRAYQSLMATWQCNQKELAARLRISESKVTRALQTLELPDDLQRAIASGNRGGMTAVKQARKRPARRDKQKPTRLSCPAGSVVVTVNPGRSVVEVLTALLEQERGKAAA
jgi:ParB family transcriptional regulator, chromosome partitioning protein